MAKCDYNISVDVTIYLNVCVEAESREEAEELALQLSATEYADNTIGFTSNDGGDVSVNGIGDPELDC